MIQNTGLPCSWGGAGVYPELGMLIATIKVFELEKSGLMPDLCLGWQGAAGAKIGQKQRLFSNVVLMLNVEGLMLAELSAALEMAWAGNRSFLRNDNKMKATSNQDDNDPHRLDAGVLKQSRDWRILNTSSLKGVRSWSWLKDQTLWKDSRLIWISFICVSNA